MNAIQKLNNKILRKIYYYKQDNILKFYWKWRFRGAVRSDKKYNVLRTVRILGNFPGLWRRTIMQTPAGNCIWGNTRFVADGDADCYLILNKLPDNSNDPVVAKIKNGNARRPVLCLHMEPTEYIEKLGYDKGVEHSISWRFYTTSKKLIQRGMPYVASPPYVHFHVGESWDFLSALKMPQKTKNLVIITSDLNDLPGHKTRLEFINAIDKSEIDCEIWGRGEGLYNMRKYRGFAKTKWDVYKNAKYALVIENSVSENYWSEKIADALLCYAYPIYHGCPNIESYFDNFAYSKINISSAFAVSQLKDLLDSNIWLERNASVSSERLSILNKMNLYAFIDNELACF